MIITIIWASIHGVNFGLNWQINGMTISHNHFIGRCAVVFAQILEILIVRKEWQTILMEFELKLEIKSQNIFLEEND